MTLVSSIEPSEEGERMKRVSNRVLVLAALTLLSGCASWQTITPYASDVPASVRIEFAPERDIVIEEPSGTSIPVTRAVRMEGRMVERDSTTVTIEVSRVQVRTAEGRVAPIRFATGALARVPVQQVAVRQTDAGRTVIAFVAIGLTIALIVALATFEMEPMNFDTSNKSTNTGTKA